MSEIEEPLDNQDWKDPPTEIPDTIPLLPIRDIVIYPYMMLPLFVGRDVSIRAVEESLERDRWVVVWDCTFSYDPKSTATKVQCGHKI